MLPFSLSLSLSPSYSGGAWLLPFALDCQGANADHLSPNKRNGGGGGGEQILLSCDTHSHTHTHPEEPTASCSTTRYTVVVQLLPLFVCATMVFRCCVADDVTTVIKRPHV